MPDTDPEVIVAGHICLDIFSVFDEQTDASGVIIPGKLVKVGPALIAVGVCWLLEASTEKMEGLISSVTSYLNASHARKA